MPRLKVTHPDQARTEYEFGEQVVSIGREVDNLVVIDAAAISRHHAVIELIEGEWWLRDLGSSNGTLHQGKRIERVRLEDRSSFEISGWKFRFTLAAGKSTAAAAEESKPPAKSRGKGKKRQRPAVPASPPASPASPAASPPPPEPPPASQAPPPASAILIPASSPPEQPVQGKAKPVPHTPEPSPVRSQVKFKLGWPLAAAAVVLISLVFVLGRKGGEKDMPPPPQVVAEPTPPTPKPPLLPAPSPTLTMREAEPPPLPPITPSPAKQAPPPPVAVMPHTDRQEEKPAAPSGKLLFAPGADHAGFQPVLSPRLDRVLQVKKAAGSSEADAWVDVWLGEEVILRRVRLSTEDQLRFSPDGSAWAVQAQDDTGRRFIALRDRTLRLEGEVRQWLGNHDFSHLAVVTRHQDEDHLSIDGEWRYSYHHLRDLHLSEDGRQWACVAMKSSPEVAEEWKAGERVVTQDGLMPICQEVLALELAPQSGRTAWVAALPDGKQEVITSTGTVWQAPPGKDAHIQSLAISGDGRRLAWAFVTQANDPVFHLESGGSWTLPVGAGGEASTAPLGGTLPPPVATRICFSPDGWHAVFAASGPTASIMSEGGAISHHAILLLDSLTLSPDGRRLAYVAMEPAAGAGSASTRRHRASLWLDGKTLFSEENAWVRQNAAGHRITMAGISSLHFSPDGRHLACLRSVQPYSGEAHIRQAWLDGCVIPEKHQHALALAWVDSDILSLAAAHPEKDTIERLEHRPKSIGGK